MYDIPIESFVSPITQKRLVLARPDVLIDEDGCEFHRNQDCGFWNFLPERSPLYSNEQWTAFKHLIDNFRVSYEHDPNGNVSYDTREDATLFGEFCKFSGKVLDIGCGPHKVPSYIRDRRNVAADYYGIDVLVGEHPKEYKFVRAMGEHIPYSDESFDITISGTSLLHYVDIAAGIREAMRVTKSDGYLCVWFGEKSREAPPPLKSPTWYTNLEVPAGADTPFHYHRFSASEFEDYVRDCGLTILEKQNQEIDQWQRNWFYRISK